MNVSKARSFAKSISYRFFGTFTSFAVVYVITGKGTLATLIAFWETVIKIVVYYWQERIWDKTQWGRKHN